MEAYCKVLMFSQDGSTALHLAAEGGHYECLRLLLESGCNINELTNVSTHSAALYWEYLHITLATSLRTDNATSIYIRIWIPCCKTFDLLYGAILIVSTIVQLVFHLSVNQWIIEVNMFVLLEERDSPSSGGPEQFRQRDQTAGSGWDKPGFSRHCEY